MLDEFGSFWEDSEAFNQQIINQRKEMLRLFIDTIVNFSIKLFEGVPIFIEISENRPIHRSLHYEVIDFLVE